MARTSTSASDSAAFSIVPALANRSTLSLLRRTRSSDDPSSSSSSEAYTTNLGSKACSFSTFVPGLSAAPSGESRTETTIKKTVDSFAFIGASPAKRDDNRLGWPVGPQAAPANLQIKTSVSDGRNGREKSTGLKKTAPSRYLSRRAITIRNRKFGKRFAVWLARKEIRPFFFVEVPAHLAGQSYQVVPLPTPDPHCSVANRGNRAAVGAERHTFH